MYKSLFFLFLISACNACTPRLDKSDDSQVQENPYPWEECSQHIEEHPCNFTLVDQHGNDVSLYDFYKQPIVLDFSVMWCGPCMDAASKVDQVKAKYASENLEYLTVLIETAEGEPATSDDCAYWADLFVIENSHVLAGSRNMIDYSSTTGWNITGWPTFFFITEDMVIKQILRGYSQLSLEAGIAQIITP